MQSPFLAPFNTPHNSIPFSKIETKHFMPAFEQALKDGRKELNSIITSKQAPTFENTIAALDKTGANLSVVSSVLFNLNHAHTNEEIQTIARDISPELTRYSNDIWMNHELFEKVKQVYAIRNNLTLNNEEAKLLDDTYKSFVRRGALLNEADAAKYRTITEELSTLTLQFGENVLAETNDFKLHITDKQQLDGLPANALEAAAARARNENMEGWLFTLHFPSYMPFMKYIKNRDLRKTMFTAYSQRANRGNKHDNKELINRITSLRIEKAKLLGYDSHADYVLEERMAGSKEKVMVFLNQLLDASLPHAHNDVEDAAKLAAKDGISTMERWDFAYYSEILKTERYSVNDEMTKPYFKLGKVEEGVFALANKLYGLTFIQNSTIDTYHPDVKAFEVFDADNSFLALLYMDYFPRNEKQGGAWMTSFRDQHIDNGNDIRPHISIVCNFTPAGENTPSLLTFNEVKTLLHEFGHALHGMLSRVTFESQSGTSVYRDFVELPSQIMENWATEKEWLRQIGTHYQTGEVIPDDLIDKLVEADLFQSGYATVRQLSFGLNDMAWHSLTEPTDVDVTQFEEKAMSATELFPKVYGSCMSTAFSHIFDGGYAAGYYGYKWAEVLDADAFESFKQNGIFDKKTATAFRKEILEKGGSAHPMTLYKNFKGAEPSIEPLLKRSGLVSERKRGKVEDRWWKMEDRNYKG